MNTLHSSCSDEEEFEATVVSLDRPYAAIQLVVTVHAPPPQGADTFDVGRMFTVTIAPGDRYFVKVLIFDGSELTLEFLSQVIRWRDSPVNPVDAGNVIAQLPPGAPIATFGRPPYLMVHVMVHTLLNLADILPAYFTEQLVEGLHAGTVLPFVAVNVPVPLMLIIARTLLLQEAQRIPERLALPPTPPDGLPEFEIHLERVNEDRELRAGIHGE